MIGDRLRQLREDAGLTQRELAEQLGISASAVGMYEQNRREPSGELLLKFCDIFGASSDWILSGSGGVLRQKSSYNLDGSGDLAGMLEELQESLSGQDGLMFNGCPLEEGDLEKIFQAMKLGAEIAAAHRTGNKKVQNKPAADESGSAER